jgi:hypothetical protein
MCLCNLLIYSIQKYDIYFIGTMLSQKYIFPMKSMIQLENNFLPFSDNSLMGKNEKYGWPITFVHWKI